MGFITTGGQIRVCAQPTTDRSKLKTEAGRFSSDGGGNSLSTGRGNVTLKLWPRRPL